MTNPSVRCSLFFSLRRAAALGFILLTGMLPVSGCKTPSTAPEAPQLTDSPILLFIGQDRIAIQDYVDAGEFPAPGGVVNYANIYDSEGLADSVRRGDRVEMNLRETLADHPQSIGMLGLYMVEEGANADGLTGIVEGRYDAQIDLLAQVINEGARPMLVRIGYEFDGIWNHYDPEKYIAAYRYLVNRLRAQSPYFLSVWHGAASPTDYYLDRYTAGVEDEDFRDWYPGDEYVDWVGVSWFISHLPMQRSMAQAMAEFARIHRKPLIVAESTPLGYHFVNKDWRNTGLVHAEAGVGFNAPAGSLICELSEDAIWEQWFEPLLRYVGENRDVVRALCYINTNWSVDPMWSPDAEGNYANGYWGDSRIEVTETLKELWKAEISQPQWVHGEDVDFADWMPSNIPALVE